jgi:hypothetical protein
MKNTIKLPVAIITAILLFGSVVKAQTTPAHTFRLGAGLEVGSLTGNIRNIHTIELGGTLRLHYGLTDKTALTLTSGFYNLFGKDFTITYVTSTAMGTVSGRSEALGVIPVKAGIKSFVVNGIYLSAEAGAWFETKPRAHPDGFYNDTKLLLSPGLGYATENIDLGLRYESSIGKGNDYGMIAFRLGFPLDQKKK